jgi:hypothetical protein
MPNSEAALAAAQVAATEAAAVEAARVAAIPAAAVTSVELPAAVVAPVVPKPEPTGSVYFDTLSAALYEKGVDSSKFTEEIITTGKLTPENRTALVGVFGEAQVAMMEHGTSTELARIRTAQDAEATKVYDSVQLPGMVDGKAAFGVLAEWSITNINDAERSTYNEMLSKGGVQAQLAVKAIKERYMQDPNYSAAANLVNGTAPATTNGVELISRTAYTAALRTAEKTKDSAAVLLLNTRAKHTMATNMKAWRP